MERGYQEWANKATKCEHNTTSSSKLPKFHLKVPTKEIFPINLMGGMHLLDLFHFPVRRTPDITSEKFRAEKKLVQHSQFGEKNKLLLLKSCLLLQIRLQCQWVK